MKPSTAPRGERDPTEDAGAGPVTADPDAEEPITVEATPLGVRNALAKIRARLAPFARAPDSLGTAETVLAEVLNNVVEHAYRHGGNGPIEVRMVLCGDRLRCEVRDYGEAMPGGILPPGLLPLDDSCKGDPPEGGFGWFLIRALARDLSYERANGQNRLRFEVPLAEV